MDENKNHPIRQLTNHLSDLIIRLIDTERERDEARKSSDDWYQHWQTKDAQLKETEAKLAAEIEEHQRTREALRDALKNAEKGVPDNGKSNQAGEGNRHGK